MTEPTTVFDLSTPELIADGRAELAAIAELLTEDWVGPIVRDRLTRRRDRIIAALDTLPSEG